YIEGDTHRGEISEICFLLGYTNFSNILLFVPFSLKNSTGQKQHVASHIYRTASTMSTGIILEENFNNQVSDKKKIQLCTGGARSAKNANTKSKVPEILWNKEVPNTSLEKLKKNIEEKYKKRLESYWDLHKWSIENFSSFWEEIWHHLGTVFSNPYEQVYRKTGDGFLECEWFPGAKFNFAENLMRIRDNRVAIIYADEYGNEEEVTFAEMYTEVKLYVAAFKKNGLKKGEVVACYMSNRKEAVFTFLAATSMGAIFGGPQPYFGVLPATNIVQKMEPKFLISIDHHLDSGIEYHNIDHLKHIMDSTPTLEKVIIIPSKSGTLSSDISNIRNSCLLENFLNTGRTASGNVPDLEFEQLPFDHPIVINFTSGTTGLPKGLVHSAGTLISQMSSIVLYWNLKCGDVIYTCYPVGWSVWDSFVVCLAWGVKLFLYAGNPVSDWKGYNFWETLSHFKVTSTFLPTGIVDKLEKQNVVPRASEAFGTFSGFDLNLPVYGGEIQAPALGMDIHCYDKEGNSILNARGEMVLSTPTPALPTQLWKDHDNSIMKETYLSKYPGVWCQNDCIWINSATGGLVVIGRSDDTLIQNGDRFGAEDIYSAIRNIKEIQDSICVGQQKDDGDSRAILFIIMKKGYSFTPEFREKVARKIDEELWYKCVPQLILETKEIPSLKIQIVTPSPLLPGVHAQERFRRRHPLPLPPTSNVVEKCYVKNENAKSYVPQVLWNKMVSNTSLEKFRKHIQGKFKTPLESYWDLYKWSIENFISYWEEIWHYLEIVSSNPYDQVYRKMGDGLLECEWFPGAKFNFAENLLKIRDSRVAIIYADEYGNEEEVTFAEMYEEVKLYAAAFKKNGLKKGECVACYMSNRKEAVFTFLASASMGAIFGGPQPYFGALQATNMVQTMAPKFLISIDHHLDSGVEYHNIDHLEHIVDSTPSLEKVIIIPSKSETLSRDISNIRNSCLLGDFLSTGRTADGNVPDLEFDQLPFDNPLVLNFTSGTTGFPKALVHSAGTLISQLSNVVLYWNLKCGDVIYSYHPVGWTLWDSFVVCLAWGVKLLLYAGNPVFNWKGHNLWGTFSKFKVTYTFLVTSLVDKLEKQNIVPGPNTNLDSLKFLTIGGSPVKPQNYFFIYNEVKKDCFVCSQYGASESFGKLSGFDLNLPVYAGEIQTPALGMDIHCYDEEGNSVVNKRGEMVVATPTPSLPIHIWKDHDKSIMKETYLSRYPGVWCQNDEIWINPVTRGLVVIGRRDNILIQNGDRFGAEDIYNAIHNIDEIQDSICVGQQKDAGDSRAILFIKMKDGYTFTPEFRDKVAQKINSELWYDCVPQLILEIKGIPYNMNNKKVENIVRKIIATNQVPPVNNIKNPKCLQDYCNIPEVLAYNKY
ncbi:unnamed protein product, partial [Larinioides sclopetarius]